MKDQRLNLSLPDRCCTAETGCNFDGSLRNVVSEPIYVQKVYDAALINSQGLVNAMGVEFTPALGRDARILRVLDIRCRKFFNPDNINDNDNLKVNSMTEISGGQLVKKANGEPVRRIGPDGDKQGSEFLVYADTTECDDEGKGTPIFGTQRLNITGNVTIELDVLFTDDCDKECEATLFATVPVDTDGPIVLTNFFELCIPSVFDSAFLPRFTEFCNISCESRLATNNIKRDLRVDGQCGNVTGNLLIALCITCEKKIIVPVQLCVLSTGFPVLSPSMDQVCSSFPTLFPRQVDEESQRRHHCGINEADNDDLL